MMTQGGATASFAFVANTGSGNVSALAVSTTGGLSSVPGSPFPAGAGAEFMALDSMHKFLYVSNQNSSTLSAFSINTSTGVLTAVPGSPFATGSAPHGVAVDSAGRFVFVGNEGGSISVFSINSANGALTPAPGSPFPANSPFGLAINPSGTFLFVTNTSTGGLSPSSLSTFQIDPTTGALTAVNSPVTTGTTPIGITADPNGKFLYSSEHMTESLAAFDVDSTSGALTRTGSSTPAAAPSCSISCHLAPLRLAVHPNDQFLYVTNVGANSLSVFNINNGPPTPLPASAPTGQHPFGVAFDPTGNFLYVANKLDNNISAFSVNASTGALAALPGSPFAAGGSAPTGIVIVAKQ
jgi:6-phosphogluconolactonase (cycloisomerase 2 family)